MYAKELREQLARLANDMSAIVNKAKSEGNRGLLSEEAEKFDRFESEYSNVEASIKRAEKAEALQADLRGVDRDQVIAQFPTTPGEAKDQDQHAAVFNRYLRGGMENLNPEQRAFMGGLMRINNTMSTTTGSQGGFTVPSGFSNQLEEAAKWFGGIDGTVSSFTTETGNPLPWPTVNDTSNVGAIVGQNATVSEVDLTFSQVTFGSYIFTSNMVKVPLALMQDSYFDLNAYLAKALGVRIGRILNTKFTAGAGAGNEPTGIVTAAVASGLTYTCPTGETTSIIYDDLVNLEHAVDPAYRELPSSKFMFHDSTLKVLKKLKDSANRPLWQPALTASFGNGAQSTILDHGYVINNDMPVMAANATSILFGDMSKYMVRKVAGDVSVLRLVERYADALQVAFLAFVRRDGNLLDAGTHPIAVLVNSAT